MNKAKTWVEISRSNLIHNLRLFRKLIGSEVKLMAVVKANAYGHGLVPVAKIVTGWDKALPQPKAKDKPKSYQALVDFLGVDSLEEALKLSNSGIRLPILILGYTLNSRLSEVIDHGFRQVVYNKGTIKQLEKLLKKNKNKKIKVHIKVETGTARQGVLEEDLLDFVKLIKKFRQIEIEGLYTHFANIEDTTDHSYAHQQLENFKRIVRKLEKNKVKIPLKHTACSAATILFPETYFDMVRVGISMYGLWSSKETYISAVTSGRQGTFKLLPVLCWKTKIAQIKKIKAGAPVSYGLTERVSRNSRIAVLPCGYWDGYDRRLSSIGQVLIHGTRCKVLGRVCMNMIMVDVSHLKNVRVEDEVVLLGKQGRDEITADEIAEKIGTINYEVVTRINPQISRVIV